MQFEKSPSKGSVVAMTVETARDVSRKKCSAGPTRQPSSRDWSAPASASVATVEIASEAEGDRRPMERMTVETAWPPELPPWPMMRGTKKASSISRSRSVPA